MKIPPPGTNWTEYLPAQSLSVSTLRELVAGLASQKRHEDVIAVIGDCLRRGEIQPWMYEVLALTMELAGRDRSEVERVLLSSRDVSPSDPDSLLFLAAYLTRFQRYEQALKLYQQVAQNEPSRPEPYILALRAARQSEQAEAVIWAAPGVLMYAWGKDHAKLHEQAEAASQWAEQQLVGKKQLDLALRLKQGMSAARQRDLSVKLEWSGAGDLDLIVVDPSGASCSQAQPYSSGGGVHIRDGYGPKQENCYEEYHCPVAWSGEYRVQVSHIQGTIVAKRATLVVTRYSGTPQEQVETIPIDVGADSSECRLTLTKGRRPAVLTSRLTAPQSIRQVNHSRSASVERALFPQLTVGSSRPFVTGLTPVVGPGGVGFEPVVTTINTGITLQTIAVISDDRRYVRLTLAPIFSELTDVFTFSFQQ